MEKAPLATPLRTASSDVLAAVAVAGVGGGGGT